MKRKFVSEIKFEVRETLSRFLLISMMVIIYLLMKN